MGTIALKEVGTAGIDDVQQVGRKGASATLCGWATSVALRMARRVVAGAVAKRERHAVRARVL